VQTELGGIVGRPFDLHVDAVGAFPTWARPRVLWVGVSGDGGALSLLQHGVQEQLVQLGFRAEERGFTPHLTLGRVNDSLPELVLPAGLPDVQVGQRVAAFSLIRSDLRPQGPHYTRLARFPLAL